MQSTARRILGATLVVGALDMAEVTLFYGLRGVPPTRIFQSVATGLLGRAAYGGGAGTAILGLGLHFVIAACVVIVYHLASRRIPLLREEPLAIGALYGLLVYGVMYFVVQPLSAAGPPNFSSMPGVLNSLFAHVACIGIPTGLLARAREE
jgi:hypothetical protein